MKVRLTLITPPIEGPDFLPILEQALAAVPIVSVWLRMAQPDEKQRLALAKLVVPIVQKHGAAAMVDAADPRFAARAGADGLHCRYSEETLDDVVSIRPERILGFGGLKLRDDAMTAGEHADYVMFGEPAPDGYCPPLDVVVDRCRWWAEIFETPCIGYALELGSIAPIAATGAEFVALGPWAFAGDVVATVKAAQAAL
jgi:thiamine-phosphate pyrophosphorylase